MKPILVVIAACALLSSAAAEEQRDRRSGIVLQAGGSVSQFRDPATREATTLGGGLDFRVVVGARSLVGVEAGLAGAMIGSDSGSLASLALESAVRLNVPEAVVKGPYRPYVFAGACWKHYELQSAHARDDVLEIPFGVGLSLPLFTDSPRHPIDLRFAFRPALGADLDPSGAGGPAADLSGVNFSFALG